MITFHKNYSREKKLLYTVSAFEINEECTFFMSVEKSCFPHFWQFKPFVFVQSKSNSIFKFKNVSLITYKMHCK